MTLEEWATAKLNGEFAKFEDEPEYVAWEMIRGTGFFEEDVQDGSSDLNLFDRIIYDEVLRRVTDVVKKVRGGTTTLTTTTTPTYGQLFNWCERLTPDQLDQGVTIYFEDTNEYHPAADLDFSVESDVIEDDHPIITVKS